MTRTLEVETWRVDPDITVLSFRGRIIAGPETLNIETLLRHLIEKGAKKFIFDLSRVDHVDSVGVGVIAACFGKTQRAGGGLRIAGVIPRVNQIFKITRLDTVIGFYTSVLAASQNFTVVEDPVQRYAW